jgi:serine/threonine protein kinase
MNLARPNELFLAGLHIANRFRVVRLLDHDGLSYTFEAEEIETGTSGDLPKLVLRVFNVADGERIAVAWEKLERFSELRHQMLAMPKSIGQVPAGEPLAGALYVTRELGERSLQELIQTTGPLDGDETHRFASHLSEALVHIHNNDLVHMDLTPGNVIRMRGWKLGEPSITRLIDRDGSVEGMLLPEARYLAPEYVRGGPAPEADVYSFGALLEYATVGRVAESWASQLFYGIVESEAQPEVHGRPPRQSKARLDHWFAISALCREPEPLVRPSAHLLQELVAAVGSPAAALLPMLSREGAYRRSLETVKDLWQRSGFEAVPGGQRRLSMTVSDATIEVLREWRDLSVAPSLSVAHLEHRLIVASHRLIAQRFGGLDPVRRPSPLRTHWEEDVVPPFDGARAWLGRLYARLLEFVPFARRKRHSRAVATVPWERLTELRPDHEFRAHVRERISSHLRALADPSLEASRRAGLETDPDRIAEAVLEELSLTAAARERIRAEEQIGLNELALRREGSPRVLEAMTKALAAEGALTLPVGDGYRYPTFQFDVRWQVTPEVAAANRTLRASSDPWGAASWWLSPNARIDGRAPRDLVGEDPDTIIEIAGAVIEAVG